MEERGNLVIWLIGLSGSGKTTIGRMLHEAIAREDPATVFLDGDVLREVWGDNLGHSLEARQVNAQRISHLCRMLDRQGITVIASVLSLFPEWQQWNRDNFSRYFEIFLDAPLDALKARDVKGLYRRAEAGELKDVVGVDIPFPTPPNPDVVADTSGNGGTPEEIAEKLLRKIREHLSRPEAEGGNG